MSSFELQFGVFRIGPLRLGLPLSCLKEVIPYGDVKPFAIRAPYISGGIDLRGTLIPLLDLTSFLGLSSSDGGHKIVVVASWQNSLVGIMADSLQGVLESDPAARSSFLVDDGLPQIVREAFPGEDGKGYVNIISPEAIFALPGLPKVAQVANQSGTLFTSQYTSVTGHLMLMKVGNLQIAVEPTAVYATILLKEILPPVVESDFYAGDTVYGGQRLPVVSTHEMLGQGRQPDGEREAFLIRYPDGIIAFAVDQVISVVPVHHNITQNIPSGTVPNQAFFAGALASKELLPDSESHGKEYFLVLNAVAMLADKALSSIARLTLEERRRHGIADTSSEASSDRNGKPMLVFDAGQLWAVDITEITEVLPLEQLVNVFGEKGYAQGLVFSRNMPIPVFCMSILTHEPSPQELTSTSSVLVVDVGDTRLGFMVTRLVGVEGCIWEKEGRAPMVIAAGASGRTRVADARSTVRTQSEQGPRTLPVMSLAKIADALVRGGDSAVVLSAAAGE